MEKQDSYKNKAISTAHKLYHGIPLRVCHSCGWRWNSFDVRKCPKCGDRPEPA